MAEKQNQNPSELNDLSGAFVETAFTAAEIERAVLEEKRLGLRDTPCAFLGEDATNKSQK